MQWFAARERVSVVRAMPPGASPHQPRQGISSASPVRSFSVPYPTAVTPIKLASPPPASRSVPLCIPSLTIEFAQQLIRQEQHLFRCGMPADAERMQVVIKHVTGINEIYP